MQALSKDDDHIALNTDRCIGCGLCISTCPTDAIALVKRDGYIPPPANLNELVKKISEKKRKDRNAG